MINQTSSSFNEIRQDVIDYLNLNKEFYPVIDSFDGSVKMQLIDILSGFVTFNHYKYMMLREESYLSTSKLKTSIYNQASSIFGYNINRKISPKISIQFLGDKINLKCGDILGEIDINGYLYYLVYFGETRTYYLNEKIEVALGIYKKIQSNFNNFDFLKSIILTPIITPGYELDNNLYKISIDDKKREISKQMEAYVTSEVISEITNSENSANFYIYNKENSFGCPLSKDSNYVFEYLETRGFINNLIDEIKKVKLIDNRFKISNILTQGADEDSLEFIREIAPLMASTNRRMVSSTDHKIIMKTFPYFQDTFCQKSDWKCCTIYCWYIAKGSSRYPRELTQKENEVLNEFIDFYKLVGITYEFKLPIVIYKKFFIIADYDCSARLPTDISESYETYLKTQIILKLSPFQLKFNQKISISDLIVEINNILYNGKKVLKNVFFKSIEETTNYIDTIDSFGNRTQTPVKKTDIIDISEENIYECNNTQYLFFDTNIELRCF